MRATWNGYLSLGNLAVPVRLYAATRSITPKFVQLHAKDHSPVGRTYTCTKENKEIPFSQVVRAVAQEGGYVEITAAEMKQALARAKNLTVKQFSDPQVIDPVYYEKPYYIVPSKGGELAYTLLREAFVRAKKIAIVTFTLYEKEHIGIVVPHDGILMLQQLRFAAELIPRADIKTPSLPQPSPDHVDLAVRLMQRHSSPFYIEDYRNEQVDYLLELINRKAKGLPLRRERRVAAHATPEDKLAPTLAALLAENP